MQTWQTKKNKRALKSKNRILKQTQDIKVAESLAPITKKLNEVNESTQKLEEIVKESITPQLAIESTHNALPTESEQIQPGVIYDTSVENTLNIMKNNIGFLNIEETDNGDFFWNGFPVEKTGSSKLKINENIYGITPSFQKTINWFILHKSENIKW